jgi:predicted transcriptional regulator
MLVTVDRSKLIHYMFEQALTASELAKRANVSLQAVRNALAGRKLMIPSASKISRAIDIAPDDFIIAQI